MLHPNEGTLRYSKLFEPVSKLRSRFYRVYRLNFVSVNLIRDRNLWLIFFKYLQQTKLPKIRRMKFFIEID